MPSGPDEIRVEIVAAVETALADGRSAVLAGVAGIGKTTLARTVDARSSRRCRWGQALAPVAWVPYLPLARAIDRPLAGSIPEVVAVVADRVGSGVLVIDDLQWADPDTLDVLPALATRIPVLGCLRSDDPEADRIRAAVEQWAEVVPVEPLDPATAARVVERVNPGAAAAEVAALVAASGGNPLFLSTRLDGRGSDEAAADRLIAIVARASPAARRALARLWLGAIDVSAEGLEEFAELDELGLVALDGDRVRPRHALLGAAAADLLGTDGRASVHGELAARSSSAGEAARHLLAAGDADGARESAVAAAETAVTDHERADHLLVAARASAEDDPVLLRAAAELLTVVRIPEAREIIVRARPATEADRLRCGALDLQTAYWTADTDAVQAGLDALAGAVESGKAPAEVEVVFRCVRARYLARVAWDPAGAILEAERALAVAEENGLEVSDPLSTLGSAALVTGDARWREWLERAVVAARSEGRVSFEFVAADTLFMGELMRGNAARCVTLAESTIERAPEQGAVSTVQQHRKNRLLAWGSVGGDAEAVVSEARDLLRLRLNPRVREHAESQLAIALADLGRDDEAVEVLAGSSAFTATDPTSRAMVINARAEADWLAGRFDGAYEAAEACRELPIGDFPPRVLSEPLRQWAAVETGGDPGAALPTPGFENLAAAALESAGIVATARDPHDIRAERSLPRGRRGVARVLRSARPEGAMEGRPRGGTRRSTGGRDRDPRAVARGTGGSRVVAAPAASAPFAPRGGPRCADHRRSAPRSALGRPGHRSRSRRPRATDRRDRPPTSRRNRDRQCPHQVGDAKARGSDPGGSGPRVDSAPGRPIRFGDGAGVRARNRHSRARGPESPAGADGAVVSGGNPGGTHHRHRR